jgi:hypothetical protein
MEGVTFNPKINEKSRKIAEMQDREEALTKKPSAEPERPKSQSKGHFRP